MNELICPICYLECVSKYNLRRHLRVHLPVRQTHLHCPKCNWHFSNKWNMERHMKRHRMCTVQLSPQEHDHCYAHRRYDSTAHFIQERVENYSLTDGSFMKDLEIKNSSTTRLIEEETVEDYRLTEVPFMEDLEMENSSTNHFMEETVENYSLANVPFIEDLKMETKQKSSVALLMKHNKMVCIRSLFGDLA